MDIKPELSNHSINFQMSALDVVAYEVGFRGQGPFFIETLLFQISGSAPENYWWCFSARDRLKIMQAFFS